MSAAESVMALVSGLPKGKRERRLFMVLQAFIDDSSEDGNSLILAGYVAPSEQWANFSTEWQEILTIRPRWHRFKMSEIMATRPGEEAMERVVHHYRLIEKYAVKAICVAVSRGALIKAVHDYGLPAKLANPYYMAWRAIVGELLNWQRQEGILEPIDFIFDDQAEAAVIMTAWEGFRANMPEPFRKMVKNAPIFRSDDDFLPLQAADLLAFWMRKAYGKHGTVLLDASQYPFPWAPSRDDFIMLQGELDKKAIRKQLRHDRDGFIRQTQKVWQISSTAEALATWHPRLLPN